MISVILKSQSSTEQTTGMKMLVRSSLRSRRFMRDSTLARRKISMSSTMLHTAGSVSVYLTMTMTNLGTTAISQGSIVKFTPVIFHNLAGYYSHLFVKNFGNPSVWSCSGKNKGNIKCIPNNEEEFYHF